MKYQITLTDELRNFTDYVDVRQTQNNGVVIGEYKMTLNDILKALSNAATKGVKNKTPFLPKNCVKLVTTVNGYEVFIELPKRQWQVNINDKKLMLGFPRMIFKYYISNNKITNLKIVAVKDNSFINDDTEIYYFPYSNVHHTTGNVCMGLNAFPNIENLIHLESMHILFFNSPFGSDYGAMALGMDLNGLIKKCKDKSFNDDLLIPTQKSFSEFFLL